MQVTDDTEVEPDYKTIEQIGELNTNQRLVYLMEQWSLDWPEIVGKLALNGIFWRLREVTDTEGNRLEYPLLDLSRAKQLGQTGVFIGPEIQEGMKEGQYVTAKFKLSNSDERDKQGNPLLIDIARKTLQALTRIPPEYVYKRVDGSIDLDETLYQNYVEQKQLELSSELRAIEEVIGKLQSQANELKTRNAETEQEIASKHQASLALVAQISSAKIERDNILAEIEDKRARLNEELEKRTADLEGNFDLQKKLYSQELSQLQQTIDDMRSRYNLEDTKLRSQTDELRDYIRSKAERLVQLEFITQAQMDALLPGNRPERDETKNWPIIDKLPGGRSEAITHIQRYLYGKKIVYPRALLENFFALLCTGDLIILSGLSGSGKTNLVKSFAEATGNFSHVIAVKPNWTSSEDLTGYYNPLQRAYLATPFLDAVIAAKRDPDHLHIICLDEMNLARVEYYFADFLSALEERAKKPTIPLYSDEEAGNVLSEFRLFVEILTNAAQGVKLDSLGDFLANEDVTRQLKNKLGVDNGESILQLHARLRRMVGGVLSIPSKLKIPSNVRFVGAVNMDDTTHFLSPKVLDRAHVLQFESPLNYWSLVANEVKGYQFPDTGIRIPTGEFPKRVDYPSFDPDSKDELVEIISGWAKLYLTPIGIEIGVRTIRQSILYRNQLSEVTSADSVDQIALNNLLRQKLLPRFSFDGTKKPRGRTENDCTAVIEAFYKEITGKLPDLEMFSAKTELADLIDRAKANHNIFNYWT